MTNSELILKLVEMLLDAEKKKEVKNANSKDDETKE